MQRILPLASAIVVLSLTATAHATTYSVGPGRTYTVPSAVAGLVGDGDVVELDAGSYSGDVAVWTADRLTLRGVGGLAHLAAAGRSAQQKAIWVIQGDDTTVENIELSGATVPDQNGAGIRQEGAGLIVRGCYFHDNENGILAGDNTNSDILVEYSTFARNGFGDGQSHNIYINHVRSFTLRYSWSHDAHVGHDVKSRAYSTSILYNRITGEDGGDPSYELQLPNGGLVVVVGNVIHQSANSPNGNIVSIADEGATNPTQAYYFASNTVVNDRGAGTFIRNAGTAEVLVVNNVFVGAGTVLSGPGTLDHNLSGVDPLFVDRAGFDFRLTAGSPAIDQGFEPAAVGGLVLVPDAEYQHPAQRSARARSGPLDLGAFEVLPPGVDAGPAVDGAPALDGGVDGGVEPDAAVDGGVDADAGLDPGADAGDAGVDGGALDAALRDGAAGLDAAGAASPGALGGGCACSAEPAGSAAASWEWGALVLLAVRARRRSTGPRPRGAPRRGARIGGS